MFYSEKKKKKSCSLNFAQMLKVVAKIITKQSYFLWKYSGIYIKVILVLFSGVVSSKYFMHRFSAHVSYIRDRYFKIKTKVFN